MIHACRLILLCGLFFFSNSFVSDAVHVSQCLGRFSSPFYSTFFIIAFSSISQFFVHCSPPPPLISFFMLSSKEAICSFSFSCQTKLHSSFLWIKILYTMLARANEVHAGHKWYLCLPEKRTLHHEY